MPIPQPVTLTLRSGSGEASVARGELLVLSPVVRFGRAFGLVAAGTLMAAALIPIPIVHLVGIPLMLLVAILAAVRQASARARLTPVQVPCPACGAATALGGGFGYRTETGPVDVQCEACRRHLDLSWAPRT